MRIVVIAMVVLAGLLPSQAPEPRSFSSPAQGQAVVADSVAIRRANEGTRWDASEIAAIISAAVALLALIVGPWSAYKIASKQIRASVISTNRQAWINDLRDELAELDAILFDIAAVQDPSEAREEHKRNLRAFVRAKARVRLFLNPNEVDHQDLVEKLAAAQEAAVAKPVDVGKLNASRKALMERAQAVLKQEWERVKAGD